MAKLDRLGWADGWSLNAYGVQVGVRVNEPEILKDVLALLWLNNSFARALHTIQTSTPCSTSADASIRMHDH